MWILIYFQVNIYVISCPYLPITITCTDLFVHMLYVHISYVTSGLTFMTFVPACQIEIVSDLVDFNDYR